MAKRSDPLVDRLDLESSEGWSARLLAEEETLDRRSLWRLGWWGVGSVAAVIIAVMASQSSLGWRRDQVAALDLARQSQQIASVAKETQNEARRLASAIDTLNGDRDRLYSRVTVLEQGLDNVTGSIARQNPGGPAGGGSPRPQTEQPAAAQAPVPATPGTTVAALTEKPRDMTARQPEGSVATPLMPARSIMAPPDPAAAKLVEPEQPAAVIGAVSPPEPTASGMDNAAGSNAAPEVAAQRTEFGVDLGAASSIEGLRGLWRGVLRSNGAAVAQLRPIIVLKEGGKGVGMQLRLVAGPFSDAAAAAKICAALIETQHPCETSVFDGQRLAMKSDEATPTPRPLPRKRPVPKRTGNGELVTQARPVAPASPPENR